MKSRFNGWKMDPEQKRVWVEALRSGKYGQTKGKLFDGKNRYCCLGLKCKLDGNLGATGYPGDIHNGFVDKTSPRSIAGLISFNTIPEDVQRVLASYNDSGKSFKWIAAYIDRYL